MLRCNHTPPVVKKRKYSVHLMACLLSAVLIATHDPNAFSVANDTVNVSKSLSVRSTTNRNLSVSQDSIVRMNLHWHGRAVEDNIAAG
jgi:hypothetical protein